VYAWGSNNSGHIGDYSTSDKVYPTQVGEKESKNLTIKNTIINRYDGTVDNTTYNNSLPSSVYMTYQDATAYDVLLINLSEIYSNINGSINLFDGSGTDLVSVTAELGDFKLLNERLFTLTVETDENGVSYVVVTPNTNNMFGTTTLTVTSGEYSKVITLTLRPLGQLYEPMVMSGKDFTVALRSDGSVWAWGDNTYGQLGDGTYINRAYPVQVVSEIDEENEVTTYLSAVNRIAAGENFALALSDDGILYAWGSNAAGQLGVEINNTTDDDGNVLVSDSRAIPVEADGTDDLSFNSITDMAAGNSHVAIVTDNNTVWTWGDNTYGQLGTGAAGSYIPAQVLGFNGGGYLTDIVDVEAGSYHTVALKKDGSVWAWGKNDKGQLGDMTTSDREYPIQVFMGDSESSGYYIERVSQISAKADNTAAVNEDTEVYVWGDNSSNQLGNPNYTDAYSTIPKQAYADYEYGGDYKLKNIFAVAVGFNHIISIDNDGNAAIWGNGTTSAQPVAAGESTTATGSTALADIRLITAGSGFSIAMNNSGNIFAWGEGGNGQIGNSGTTSFEYPVYTGEKSALIYRFTTGESQDIDSSDKSSSDSLEYTNEEYLTAPSVISILEKQKYVIDTEKATKIEHPGFNMINLVDVEDSYDASNEVTFVSDNENIVIIENGNEVVPVGQYGTASVRGLVNGETVWTAYFNVIVDGKLAAPKVEAGTNFSMALRVTGEVYAWGENTEYQLGDGTTENHNSPSLVQFNSESSMPSIIGISASNTHALMVTVSNEVLSIGLNDHGQLGNGTTDSSMKAYYVYETNDPETYSDTLYGIIDVAAGENHSLALTTDGRVYAWGSNDRGQLGNGKIGEDVLLPQLVLKGDSAAENEVLTDIVAIDAGDGYSLALRSDGMVYAWGSAANGRLGTILTGTVLTPAQVWKGEYDAPWYLENVIKISAGTAHAAVIDISNKVYAWGANTYGQLGNGTTTDSTTPVRAANQWMDEQLAIDISAGGNHTAAVTKEGTAYAWGLNSEGQAGTANSSVANYTEPEQILEGDSANYGDYFRNALSISAGGSHTIILQKDGSVWATGRNVEGQLGDFTNNSYYAVVQSGEKLVKSLSVTDAVILDGDGNKIGTVTEDDLAIFLDYGNQL
ncbi:MAG: hypothetical protein LIO94_02670, partial [Clostridiales bacterium]|nr:hypothetical protein [Clostridiales bacterium]